jgi:uncharacterized membrane protein YhaH (DUF805 family)
VTWTPPPEQNSQWGQQPQSGSQYGQNEQWGRLPAYTPPSGHTVYDQPPVYPTPSQGDPGIDLPWYSIGFFSAIKRAFQKYGNFSGRASRGEYWWFFLADILIVLALYTMLMIGGGGAILAQMYEMGERMGTGVGLGAGIASVSLTAGGTVALIAMLVYVFATLVPRLALTWRRLHDSDKAGTWFLINFVPFGGIVLIVLLASASNPLGVRFDRGAY